MVYVQASKPKLKIGSLRKVMGHRVTKTLHDQICSINFFQGGPRIQVFFTFHHFPSLRHGHCHCLQISAHLIFGIPLIPPGITKNMLTVEQLISKHTKSPPSTTDYRLFSIETPWEHFTKYLCWQYMTIRIVWVTLKEPSQALISHYGGDGVRRLVSDQLAEDV